MQMSPLNYGQIPAAVLVDGENVPRWALPGICKKLEEEGASLMGADRLSVRTDVRRIYADWSRPDMSSWTPHIRSTGFRPMQQIRYAQAKDVIDQHMTIDALDLLHQRGPMLIGLASSDSDFAPLVQRLRESGAYVIGFMDEKAPVPYRETCNRVVFFSQLEGHAEAAAIAETVDQADHKKSLRQFMVTAYEKAAGENGRAVFLSHLGQVVHELDPDFDSSAHGYQKLVDLVKALDDDFEVEKEDGNGKPPVYKVSLVNRRRR